MSAETRSSRPPLPELAVYGHWIETRSLVVFATRCMDRTET